MNDPAGATGWFAPASGADDPEPVAALDAAVGGLLQPLPFTFPDGDVFDEFLHWLDHSRPQFAEDASPADSDAVLHGSKVAAYVRRHLNERGLLVATARKSS
jgi:hypothetical protein